MFFIVIRTRIFINEEDTSEEAEVMIGERYHGRKKVYIFVPTIRSAIMRNIGYKIRGSQ